MDDAKTSLLAWTTTPWTLPSNLALCVHPDFTYIKIYDEQHDQNFILAEGLLKTLYKDPKKAKFKKLGTFKGSDMKGWRYVPLFEYFTEQVCNLLRIQNKKNSQLTLATSSSKIKLSGCSMTPTSLQTMVQVSFIKHLLLERTITVSPSPTVYYALKRCHHARLMTRVGSQRRSLISLVSTSRSESLVEYTIK